MAIIENNKKKSKKDLTNGPKCAILYMKRYKLDRYLKCEAL